MQPKAKPDTDPVNLFTGRPIDPDGQRLNDAVLSTMRGAAALSPEAIDLIGENAMTAFSGPGLDLRHYPSGSQFVRDAIAVINQLAGLPKTKQAADIMAKTLSGLHLPVSPSAEEIQTVEALTVALLHWDEQPQSLGRGGGVGSFFNGVMQGFESGSNLSAKMREVKERRALRNELKRIASTTAEDAGTGLKVTGGGEVASQDQSTTQMVADQENAIRAFRGNSTPAVAAPMVDFGGDLIKTDGSIDGAQINNLRMNRMTGAALSNWSQRKFADGGEVLSHNADKRDQNEFSAAFNGNQAPAEEKPAGNFESEQTQTVASIDGDQLRKLRLEKMADAAMRHGAYDVAATLGQTRMNTLKLDEAEQGTKDKKELRSALLSGGIYPPSQYAQKVAPKVIETMLKQGNAAGAEAFQKFIDSQDGRKYNNRWDKIMRTYANGDFAAALPLITELYNADYPDGHTAKITPLGEGRYRFQHLNDAGEVIETGEGSAKQLADLGVFTLSPEKRAELTFKSQAEDVKAKRQTELETMKQDRQDARSQASLEAMEDRLTRNLDAREGRGGLSVPQLRKNEEIKAARKQLTGMSKAELLKRTQSTTNTGRSNPDYDAGLASMARLANSRMYGEDSEFDAFQSPAKPAVTPAKPATLSNTLKDHVDVRRRFRDDPDMKGYSLGKRTPQGVEVLDAAGNHIGFYD